jgi:hypothetical protein
VPRRGAIQVPSGREVKVMPAYLVLAALWWASVKLWMIVYFF